MDCFTADAEFRTEFADTGETTFVAAGTDQIHELIRRHTRPPYGVHHHDYTQPVIYFVDDDTATCTSRVFIFFDDNGRPILRTFATNRETLVGEPDGAWRVKERVSSISSRVPDAPPMVFGMPEDP